MDNARPERLAPAADAGDGLLRGSARSVDGMNIRDAIDLVDRRRPGLIERACAELALDAGASFVVGDKPCDVDLGLVVNATTILVTTGYWAAHAEAGSCRPHHVAGGLPEAAGVIESIVAARASGGVERA